MIIHTLPYLPLSASFLRFRGEFPFKTKDIESKTMITDYLFDNISHNFKYKLEKKVRIKFYRMAGYDRKDIFIRLGSRAGAASRCQWKTR